MAEMQFVALNDCLIQNAEFGVNVSLKRGKHINSTVDLTKLSRHVKNLGVVQRPELSPAPAADEIDETIQEDVAAVGEETSSYGDQSRNELITEAKRRDITGADRMPKDELVDVLRRHDEINAGALSQE